MRVTHFMSLVSLVAILVGIIIIILAVIGIHAFQQLVSQNHPLALGMILGVVIMVFAIACQLGWAKKWLPPNQS